MDRYAGTYRYEYEYNTDSLQEDQYIVLEVDESTLQGWFYGTSDEFDDGREGYLPGFFVAEMKNLEVIEGALSFTVRLSSEDCFAEPVPLQYRRFEEVPSARFQRWQGPTGIESSETRYEGMITDQGIELLTRFGPRTFARDQGS